MKTLKRMLLTMLVVGASMGLVAPGMAQAVELAGAGSSFAYPLYSKAFYVYNQNTGVQTNYQSIGSGGGIRQLMSKIVDFGGTDAFLNDKQLKDAPAAIVHVPTALGAVVVTYNLKDNPELKFTPDVLSDIYLGKIKKWDDPRLKAINPGVDLPHLNITVVHRSDGSGTTFIFSNYLSKVSTAWKKSVGEGTALDWPVGIGGKGNPGVAGYVKQIPGAIGYVELIYVLQNEMPVSLLQNKSGNFVKPTIESTSLSANVPLPDDTRVAITDTDAAQGYPITGFTWAIFYKEQNYSGRSKEKAESLVKLMWWMIHDGQAYEKPLHYAPLPMAAVKKAETILKSVTYNGQPILK